MEDAGSATDGIQNNYGTAAEFGSTSCGLIFQREAAGMVEAIGPQVQVTSGDVSVVYQGDVMLGRLACGADYLTPQLLWSFTLPAPSLPLSDFLFIYTQGILRGPFFLLNEISLWLSLVHLQLIN